MTLAKTLKSLCAPAQFYLAISVIVAGLILVQNLFSGESNELCVGSYSCEIPHVALFFVIKVLYVLFWTWFLNLLCKHGLKTLSWFLVLIPFLLFALVLAVILYSSLEDKNVKKEKKD